MNLFIRLLILLFRRGVPKLASPLTTGILRMRVWPNDLDIFGHINNGRYLTIMDLGRVDMMLRTGFWKQMQRSRWYPLVGTALIDYRRPLKLFETFEMHTRVMGWDERWFYLEQIFLRSGEVAARATLKVMIRDNDGVVVPKQALAAIGINDASPHLPAYISLMDGKERLATAA